jgi:predicted DNA-binding transcriptional regulator YafY
MDLLHRFFQLHRLLQGRRTPLARRDMEVALSCSTSTVKRLINELRNYGAPIELVPGQGYRYQSGARFDLPGLALSPTEVSALLLAHLLLGDLAEPRFKTLQQGVVSALAGAGLPAGELAGRLRIKPSRSRGEPACLPMVLDALLVRSRLSIAYHGRSRGSDRPTRRDIAPQRLTRYRDRWYLDAWCYLRRDLRSFALERVQDVRRIDGACDEVSDEVLTLWTDASYGIFNGPGRHLAVLRFTPERARWAADECWHARASGHFLPDGSFELKVPYSDPTELMRDVMRLGAEVEVMAPPSLREAFAQAFAQAARLYECRPT